MTHGSVQALAGSVSAAEHLSAAMDSEWESAAPVAGNDFPGKLTAEEKQSWSLYHLVGDALRSDDLLVSQASASRFTANVMARLDAEPAWVAPVRQRERMSFGVGRWALGRRVMPSFAAAAAAATIAWVLVPSMHGGALPSAGGATQVASQDGWQRVNLSSDRDLDPYLAAHQQFASDRAGLGYASYTGRVGQ